MATPALRLGLRLVKGLPRSCADALAAVVAEHGPFRDVEALWLALVAGCASDLSRRRAALALRRLAAADAFPSMGLTRQHALWQVRALHGQTIPLFDQSPISNCHFTISDLNLSPPASPPPLPVISAPRQVAHDYAALGLSLKAHPLAFMRGRLDALGTLPAAAFQDPARTPHGARAAVAGLVLVRQRPGTASGVVFMTLEDETGIVNLIVRPRVYTRYRPAARHGVILLARGRVERQGLVVHILADRLTDIGRQAVAPAVASRDFH